MAAMMEGVKVVGTSCKFHWIPELLLSYSPSLMWGDDDEDNGSGVVVSNEVEDAEFPTERQKADEPLFRILSGGHSSASVAV